MKIVFALVVILTASVAEAQRADSELVGIGATRCGAVTTFLGQPAKAETTKTHLLAWAQGFLSAMNSRRLLNRSSSLELPDPATTEAFLTSYCEDNPLDQTVDAVSHLWIQLVQRSEP